MLIFFLGDDMAQTERVATMMRDSFAIGRTRLVNYAGVEQRDTNDCHWTDELRRKAKDLIMILLIVDKIESFDETSPFEPIFVQSSTTQMSDRLEQIKSMCPFVIDVRDAEAQIRITHDRLVNKEQQL